MKKVERKTVSNKTLKCVNRSKIDSKMPNIERKMTKRGAKSTNLRLRLRKLEVYDEISELDEINIVSSKSVNTVNCDNSLWLKGLWETKLELKRDSQKGGSIEGEKCHESEIFKCELDSHIVESVKFLNPKEIRSLNDEVRDEKVKVVNVIISQIVVNGQGAKNGHESEVVKCEGNSQVVESVKLVNPTEVKSLSQEVEDVKVKVKVENDHTSQIVVNGQKNGCESEIVESQKCEISESYKSQKFK